MAFQVARVFNPCAGAVVQLTPGSVWENQLQWRNL